MGAEVFSLVKKKGLLLEKEIYELLVKIEEQKAIEFLEQIERISGQKFITKRVLENNISYLKNLVQRFNEEDKNVFDRIISDFSIYNGEESKKIIEEDREKKLFEVINSDTRDRKIEVSDFVNSFKLRFQQIQKILMSRAELQKDLISIGKISSYKSQLSAIGIVTEKTITKNKNILITIEDLTGSIRALVKFEDKETFRKAEEILLDDIIGIKAVGSKDILFVQDIFYPDIIFKDKVKFEEDFNIAFISDIHCGSDRHLSKSFNNFIEWLNSEDESAKKIKYLFIVGDNVDGVGVFPGQEKLLNVTSIKKQYELLANYLKNVPKNITMFLCPGQHDAVRVAEPQPIIGKKYGSALWEIENLILVTNPAMVKLFEDKKEFKILMYHGASLHSFINEIRELREIKAHGCPAKAVKHILKRRHLSPIHSEAIYIPNPEEDALIIKEVPDVLCTGEVHRLDIETYNGVLIITGSCWQAQTPFEEKVGNLPDPAKVPVLNLKTRELKVFDFC